MDKVKTRLKIFPTLLKLFVGIIGIFGLFFLSVIIKGLFMEQTYLLLVMTIVYSTLTFLSLGFGLFSIKTFLLNNHEISENYLFGLLKIKTSVDKFESFKSHMTSNNLRTFEELVLNKKTGDTIFIQEFDQKKFEEFKVKLSTLVKEDNNIKPNYWTRFYKIATVMLILWYLLLIGLIII